MLTICITNKIIEKLLYPYIVKNILTTKHSNKMAQKRKPNIVKKPEQVETTKTEPVIIPKVETVKATVKSKHPESKKNAFLFDKINYLLMLLGIVLIAVGLVVMSGGGSTDPKVFNPDIFNTQRLTVAPLLILLGFVVEVFAIMIKPKEKAGS